MLARLNKYGEANQHDWYKFIALIIMTIDHVGAYLYPHDLWYRALGRITFPVWFFLAGYPKGTKISLYLMFFVVLVLLANYFTYHPIFPLNALVSIIACRLTIALLYKLGTKFLYDNLIPIFVMLVFLYVVFLPMFEYGSLAIAYAIFGHIIRLKHDGQWPTKTKNGRDIHPIWNRANLYIILCLIAFVGTQNFMDFEFNIWQILYVTIGTTICVYKLANFQPYTPLKFKNPVILNLIKLGSRYSLEYYFLHRAILMSMALWINPELTHVFKWIVFED